MHNAPTTEDRIWAVLSHLSSLALGMGIALPIVGWADQRRKSNYAAFQCLQALGYQSVGYTIWVLSTLVMIVLAAIVLLAVPGFTSAGNQTQDVLLAPWMVLFFTLVFGLFLLYFVLSIVAAVACAFGRDFHYPILGDRLARYLGYISAPASDEQSSLIEENEYRWIAAMGHFSILILLWGMLAPLTAWLLHGKHNPFLKFQSIQALVFQIAVTLLYLGTGFFYFLSALLLITATGLTGDPNLNTSTGMMGVVVFGVSSLISLVILLLVPLLHILGQWAGYRVLKGEDYRYPLIGRFVERGILKNPTIKEKTA